MSDEEIKDNHVILVDKFDMKISNGESLKIQDLNTNHLIFKNEFLNDRNDKISIFDNVILCTSNIND